MINTKKDFLVESLLILVPDAEFISINNDLNLLQWKDERPKPSEEQIQAKIAELEAAEPLRLLRLERDRLIQQTDWWVLPDRTATPAQLAYRQALRDLPANSTPALDENGNLTGVEWPVYSEEA
jgi:hypothetical protein